MLPFSLINDLIQTRKYKSYLEVGVKNCNTFGKVICETKIGIDPAWTKDESNIYKLASDEYFERMRDTFDLVFIDGLHEKQQVLRDVYNSLRVLNPGGMILLHDCLPKTERNQGPYFGGDWTGDVWKAMVEIRKDSSIDSVTVDIDWGVGLVINRPNSLTLNCPVADLNWKDYVDNRDSYLRVVKDTEITVFLGGY
jgi:hypothetical protein